MCWAKKCCGVLKLDLGCTLIGTISLIITSTLSVACIVILTTDNNDKRVDKSITYRLSAVLNIDYKTLMEIIIIMIIVAITGIFASFALIRGMEKNKPGLVVCYLSYGIVVTIFVQLSAILILLNKKWEVSLCLFLASLFYIHILVVVHTVYETMQRGKNYGANQHQIFDDECCIVSDDEF